MHTYADHMKQEPTHVYHILIIFFMKIMNDTGKTPVMACQLFTIMAELHDAWKNDKQSNTLTGWSTEHKNKLKSLTYKAPHVSHPSNDQNQSYEMKH